MTRGISAAQQTASAAGHRCIAPLVEMAFASGTLRLALAPFNITEGANTYVATGSLIDIEPVKESASSREGISLSMSGLDPTIIALAASEQFRGRMLTIRKVYLDANTNQAIGSSVVMWIGRIRSMATTEDNNNATVTVTAEHFEAELGRAATLRLNNADQQRLYPGDRGCEYAEETTTKTIVFPSKEAQKR
jgi:hypothetical protein